MSFGLGIRIGIGVQTVQASAPDTTAPIINAFTVTGPATAGANPTANLEVEDNQAGPVDVRIVATTTAQSYGSGDGNLVMQGLLDDGVTPAPALSAVVALDDNDATNIPIDVSALATNTTVYLYPAAVDAAENYVIDATGDSYFREPTILEQIFDSAEAGAEFAPWDLSTLFQNTNGTGAVTTDGDQVRYMGDRTGNGNHAIATTTDDYAIYKTDGTLHWLKPGPTGARFTVGAAGDFNFLHDGTGCEWFFAAQPADVANPDALGFFWATGTSNSSLVGSTLAYDDRSSQSFSDRLRFDITKGVEDEPVIVASVDNTIPSFVEPYVFNGGHATSRSPQYFVNRDGSSVYSGDYVRTPVASDSVNPLTLLARADSNFPFSGKFYGGLFIDRLLTTSEQSAVLTEYENRAGVT